MKETREMKISVFALSRHLTESDEKNNFNPATDDPKTRCAALIKYLEHLSTRITQPAAEVKDAELSHCDGGMCLITYTAILK